MGTEEQWKEEEERRRKIANHRMGRVWAIYDGIAEAIVKAGHKVERRHRWLFENGEISAENEQERSNWPAHTLRVTRICAIDGVPISDLHVREEAVDKRSLVGNGHFRVTTKVYEEYHYKVRVYRTKKDGSLPYDKIAAELIALVAPEVERYAKYREEQEKRHEEEVRIRAHYKLVDDFVQELNKGNISRSTYIRVRVDWSRRLEDAPKYDVSVEGLRDLAVVKRVSEAIREILSKATEEPTAVNS